MAESLKYSFPKQEKALPKYLETMKTIRGDKAGLIGLSQ